MKVIHDKVQSPPNPGATITCTGSRLTVGDLRNAIAFVDNNVEIDFGTTMSGVELHFYRFKDRRDDLFRIELCEEE